MWNALQDFVVPALTFGVPGSVLIISYLLLVREFGCWNLFPITIHESGKHTLSQTILYFNHFLREVPIDTLFAFAILWTLSAAGLHGRLQIVEPGAAFVILGVFLLFVFMGSIRAVGLHATLADLLQFRERDDLVGWGSHWHMHFLSTAAILLLLIAPGALLPGAAPLHPHLVALAAVFAGFSLVFKTPLRALTHTRWILHGAREFFTYLVMVAIPAFAPLLSPATLEAMRPDGLSVLSILAMVAIVFHILVVYRRSDLDEEASSRRGSVYLVTSHFFEHVLDYVYILLLVAAVGAR